MKEGQPAHKNHSLLVISLAWLCAFIPLAIILYSGLKGTGGIFTYPVDDTYIHLKIAGNLADSGSWGINPGEFNSASSSLLYTLLLAVLVKIFQDPILIPIVINAIAGTWLLIVLWQWLKRQGLSSFVQLIILLLVVFFTPLPVLILSGMEHVLQCLFTFLFLTAFLKWMEKNFEAKAPWQMFILAILLVATRYEGLFIVFGACLLLCFKKQWRKAFLLAALAMLPVFIFGWISMMKGSYFLPNSVLVKSEAAQFTLRGMMKSFNTILVEKFMFAKAGITLLATQRLLLLLPLTYLVCRKPLKTRPSWTALLMILTVATFLQLGLADTGKFYRYEAYLVMMSVLIISLVLFSFYKEMWRQSELLTRTFFILIFSFLAFPILLRSMAAFTKAPGAMVNIYEQQYQMGWFLKKYFPQATIAANDIGAISYYREGRILDLWGLGTLEIARSKKGNYWNAGFLDSMARKENAGIAIIYDSWIANAIPQQWKKVANWKISNNVVAGDDNVSFYVIDRSVETELIKGLKEFEPQLPPTVNVAYY